LQQWTLLQKVLKSNNVPEGVFNLIIAKSSVLGDNFLADKRITLFSVTGSTAVGKRVGQIVGKRLGKTILELGGNNAVIVSNSADLEMAIPSIIFGAVGTAGQRCTSTRRVIIHEKIYSEVKERLIHAYKQIDNKIGNPLDKNTLVGPLIDIHSVNAFTHAVEEVKKEGGRILFGGEVLDGDKYSSGNYVIPAIAEAQNHYNIVQEETFAPIVYLIKYKEFDEAIELNNGVPPRVIFSIIYT